MFQKRTFTARMLWASLIMLSVFVSFLATPATLTHANSHDSTAGLRMHRPVYNDGAQHAVSANITIDRPAGIMALCAFLQPGETKTLDMPGGLQTGDDVEISWYTDDQCEHSPSSAPAPYKTSSYAVDHLPYDTINFP